MVDKISLAKKLKALADSTTYGHERENSLDKLNQLMEKHGITEADLSSETTQVYKFHYKTERQRRLLEQVSFKVTNDTEFYRFTTNGRKNRNQLGVKCTLAQQIEIDFLYDFYLNLYEKEETAFFDAFTQKHRIFGTKKTGESAKISADEYEKMQSLMSAMDNATPIRRLEGANEK